MISRGENGFTLVELLVATVILGIISFALTESVISGFDNTGDTEERLVESLDRQRVTRAFVPDVQSTQTMDDSPPCGSALDPGDQVLKTFHWSDDGGVYLAAYVVTDRPSTLVRHFCVNGEPDEPEELAQIKGTIEIDPDVPPEVALRMCPPGAPEKCPKPDFAPYYEVVAARRVAE